MFGALALGAALIIPTQALISTQALADTLTVSLDRASLMKLPDGVSTIVIGNPLIADITVQAGGIAVVTGKGYGATNMIALDRSGATLLEKNILVQGPRERVVVVFRGMDRESYSCTPNCERRITLGDAPTYFDATLGQIGNRSGQAQGSAGGAAR